MPLLRNKVAAELQKPATQHELAAPMQLTFAFPQIPLARGTTQPGVFILPSKITYRPASRKLTRSILLKTTELKFATPEKSLAIEAQKKAESPRYAAYPSTEWQIEKMTALQRADVSISQKTRIKEELAVRFQDYLHQQADIQWRRFGQIDGEHGRNDIRSAARLAFFEAVERWDSKHGKPLIHLVAKSIRQASSAYAKTLQNGNIPFPPKILKLCRKYQHALENEGFKAAEALLENSNSREETKNIVRTHAKTHKKNTLSINASYASGSETNDTPFGDTLADPVCPNAKNETRNIFQALRDIIMRKLNPRQRIILMAMHGNVEQFHDLNDGTINLDEDAPLHEIASPLGITRERVRQLRQEIYTILKRELDRLGLDGSCLAAFSPA